MKIAKILPVNISILLLFWSAVVVHTQPNAPNTYLGQQAQSRGDWDTAIFHFTNAINSKEIKDSYYIEETAYSGRAEAYFKKNDLKRAMADCNKGIELTGSISLYRLRASIYDKLDQVDNAIADIKWLIKSSTENAWNYYLLGIYHGHKGNYDESIADYRLAIRLDPDDLEFIYSRAWANLYANYGSPAADDADKYIEGSGFSDKHYKYGVLVAYIGRRKAKLPREADAFLSGRSKTETTGDWPDLIMKFMIGKLSNSKLLKLATDNDKLTEAHTYIGERYLFSDNTPKAIKHFWWVKSKGNHSFLEYDLSVAELKRLSTPTKPKK